MLSVPPVHPGIIVGEAIDALGLPKAQVALMLGMHRQHLHAIVNGKKPISPAVAVKLGKLLGNGARVWVDLQADFDTWQAEQKVDVSGIRTLVGRGA